MRIGIFAGTFDPIHAGHVRYAQAAVHQTDLDKVIIVAEKNPYRKKPFASWDHRQAMIERATESLPEADHDYEFSNQLARQHTMQNMLATARKHYGADHEIWFLVGSDIFEHMNRWMELARREEYGGFIVALRGEHTKQWLDKKQTELAQLDFGVRIKIINNHHPHISSRKIRDDIAANQLSVNLPTAVYKYITQQQLYR